MGFADVDATAICQIAVRLASSLQFVAPAHVSERDQEEDNRQGNKEQVFHHSFQSYSTPLPANLFAVKPPSANTSGQRSECFS